MLAADLAASPVSMLLLVMRGYGIRARRRVGGTFQERLERFGFTKLAETPGRELVFGLAGQFWRPSGGLLHLAGAQAFETFAEEGCVKAAWNLRIDEAGADATEFSTETRIASFGPAARRKFRLYWSVVGLFSGLLRRALLRQVARNAAAG